MAETRPVDLNGIEDQRSHPTERPAVTMNPSADLCGKSSPTEPSPTEELANKSTIEKEPPTTIVPLEVVPSCVSTATNKISTEIH